jgi:hypothetical protein
MFQKIRNKIRNIIQDNSKSSFETFIIEDGLSLPIAQDNVLSITNVTVQGTTIGSAYSYDSENKIVTLESGMATTNDVVVVYFTYTKYSNTELDGFILSALSYLDIFTYPTSFLAESGNTDLVPIPSIKEQNLIAMVASILIKPDFNQYQTSSVNVKYPRTMTKEKRIEDLIAKFKFSKVGITGTIDLDGEDAMGDRE